MSQLSATSGVPLWEMNFGRRDLYRCTGFAAQDGIWTVSAGYHSTVGDGALSTLDIAASASHSSDISSEAAALYCILGPRKDLESDNDLCALAAHQRFRQEQMLRSYHLGDDATTVTHIGY